VTSRPAAQRICVAQIGAPHGVRGEVKLRSFTADPLAVKDYGALESEDGAARFEIEAVRPAKDHLVARLRGVNDRDAAERLGKLRLYVPRERLPAPEAGDEFYHADLVGLAAVDAAGHELGRVVAVHNFGAGDLIEIKVAEGNATVMMPFTDAAVPDVDIAGGRIVVDAELFASAAAPPKRSLDKR
jgi:16S rRNA processing protein RimM